MKVTGFTLRTMSITYTTTVGKVEACSHVAEELLRSAHKTPRQLTSVSVMMVPEADQVNTSICPGVSKITYLDMTCDASKHMHIHVTNVHVRTCTCTHVHTYTHSLVFWCPLLYESHDLIETCGKEIQGCNNSSIWPQVVLLHHLLVLDSVPDVWDSVRGHVTWAGHHMWLHAAYM